MSFLQNAYMDNCSNAYNIYIYTYIYTYIYIYMYIRVVYNYMNINMTIISPFNPKL